MNKNEKAVLKQTENFKLISTFEPSKIINKWQCNFCGNEQIVGKKLPYCDCRCSQEFNDSSKCNLKEFVEIYNYYGNMENAIMFAKYKKCVKCNQIAFANGGKYIEKYVTNYKDDPTRFELFDLLKKIRNKEGINGKNE